MANRRGKTWKQLQIFSSLAPKSLQMVTAAMKSKDAASWKESYDKPRQHIKSIVKAMVFPVVMYWCESWTRKKAKHWGIAFQDSWESKKKKKTLESPLDCKEIQPVNPKGNQSWMFILRIDAEVPILWPSDVKSWLIGKDPDAGKDWRQEEQGMTKDEMVRRHHWLNGHEFEQAPGDSEGQGGLGCCSPWGHKESDMTSDWITTTPNEILVILLGGGALGR